MSIPAAWVDRLFARMLARYGNVWLRMWEGINMNIVKADLAEQQTTAIINSGKFALNNTRYGIRAGQPGDAFSDMFIYGNQRRYQGNKEAIWVMEQESPVAVPGGITNNPQQRRNWGAAYYQINSPDGKPMIMADSLGGRGIARMRLTDWVVYGLYPQNDMRNSQLGG